jgi:ABC-type uncharacterized transport system substrate-binding protein
VALPQLAPTGGSRQRNPACSSRHAVEVGVLMSYGTDTLDRYRQVAVHSGRILKGAKPAELPVTQSTKRAGHQPAPQMPLLRKRAVNML